MTDLVKLAQRRADDGEPFFGELAEEIERLRADSTYLRAKAARHTDEIKNLRRGLRDYACTGTDKPCGCYAEFVRDTAEIERLQAHLNGSRLAFDIATIELEALRPEVQQRQAEVQQLKTALQNISELRDFRSDGVGMAIEALEANSRDFPPPQTGAECQ